MTSARPSPTALALADLDGLQEAPRMNEGQSRAEKARAAEKARLRAMVDQHFHATYRALQRLGVPSSDLDDSTQQVFWIASRKLGAITPGSERAFLLGTALRVAKDARRTQQRRREVLEEPGDERPDESLRPDALADQKRLRALLDQILAAMPDDLREVFVLFELEECSSPQIAELLDIPVGTVASRLRRAREDFEQRVKRLDTRGGLR